MRQVNHRGSPTSSGVRYFRCGGRRAERTNIDEVRHSTRGMIFAGTCTYEWTARALGPQTLSPITAHHITRLPPAALICAAVKTWPNVPAVQKKKNKEKTHGNTRTRVSPNSRVSPALVLPCRSSRFFTSYLGRVCSADCLRIRESLWREARSPGVYPASERAAGDSGGAFVSSSALMAASWMASDIRERDVASAPNALGVSCGGERPLRREDTCEERRQSSCFRSVSF